MIQLTVRKQKWANKFKPNIIRGIVLNPNAAVEQRYYSSIAALIERMTAETSKAVNRLFHGEVAEEYLKEFTEDASIASQARILTNALKRKFEQLFATHAIGLAVGMVTQNDKAASKQLHSSIQQLSGGLSLPTTTLQGAVKDILSASVAENVALIKTIPQQYLAGVQGAVMRSITNGNGLQDLVPYIAKHKSITLRRARFIANDQTKKAFENICTGRMISLGFDRFQWQHIGGSNHPRKEHIEMSGNIYSLKDPPYDKVAKMKVLPGQLPGCRCKKIPIIEFGDE